MRNLLRRIGFLLAATVVTLLWFPILIAMYAGMIVARALYEIKRQVSRLAG